MKIPFLNLWVRVYWWMPTMEPGWHSIEMDMTTYWALNLLLFSIEFCNESYAKSE